MATSHVIHRVDVGTDARDHALGSALEQDLGWFWYYWLWTTESVDGSIATVTTSGARTIVTVRQDGQMPSPIVLKVTFAPAGPAIKPMANAKMESDTTAIGQSVGVIALAAVAAGIGNIYYGGLSGIVSGAFMSVIGFLVWSLIIWLVGTKLMPEPATKADYPETFRVLGFAAAPGLASVITIIPILGWILMFLIWVWQIAAGKNSGGFTCAQAL